MIILKLNLTTLVTIFVSVALLFSLFGCAETKTNNNTSNIVVGPNTNGVVGNNTGNTNGGTSTQGNISQPPTLPD